MARLCVAAGLVVAAAGLARGQPAPEAAKEKQAALSARNLMQACEAFFLNPQSGNMYPKTLAELAKPPFGGASFLRNPEKDLLDPWGKEFRYKVVKQADGAEEPFVWSERVVVGVTKVYGKKPPERKKK